jgi:hypothetical protein
MFWILNKLPKISYQTLMRLLVFLPIAASLVAVILLPTALHYGGPKYSIYSGFSADDSYAKQEENTRGLMLALSSGAPFAFRARTVSASGPFWELRADKLGDLISVRDGKQTALLMPAFKHAPDDTWIGVGRLLNRDENFVVSITPQPCGRHPLGNEGSGSIWIKFDDPTRDFLEGCVFLEEQAHDYPPK